MYTLLYNNMIAILIFLAIMASVIQSINLNKISGLNESIYTACISVFTGLVGLFFLVISLSNDYIMTNISLFFGITSGFAIFISIFLTVQAMKNGPLSYTIFFISTSLIISVISGIIFWDENLTTLKIISIFLFISSFYFISLKDKAGDKSISLKWLLYCIGAWFFNGSNGVLQKLHQTYTNGKGSEELISISFLTASVLALIIFVIRIIKNKEKLNYKELWKSNWMKVIIIAIGGGGANYCVTLLSGTMNSSYLFPLILGGSTLGVFIYSSIIGEKHGKYGKIAIVLGIIAMFMINL